MRRDVSLRKRASKTRTQHGELDFDNATKWRRLETDFPSYFSMVYKKWSA